MSGSSPVQEHRDWYVFETIVADGTWATGIANGVPSTDHVMVVADRLTHGEALRLAQQRADASMDASPDAREGDEKIGY